MATNTQVQTFADLYTDLQNRLRLQTAVTATQDIAKRKINTALQDMHVGFKTIMPWSERHQILVTQPEYNAGTLSVTKGSTTITGVGTLWNTVNDFSANNMRVDGKIVISGGTEIYRISAIASDTSATLSSAFTQDTVSGGTYLYFEDEYDLHADFDQPFDMQFFDDMHAVEIIGRREFRFRYPRSKITGKPNISMIVDREFSGNTTPRRRIVFHKPPDEAYSFPYNFVTNKLAISSAGTAQTSLSADTDEPIVPLKYRHVIVLGALYPYYLELQDDKRARETERQYTDLMLRITGDREIGSSRPQIQPVVGPYKRRAAQPYSGATGRYVTGSRFDEIR